MNFGSQIKLIRNKNNLTQEQFAEQLNISRQTVSAWENNRYFPDIEMIVDISKTFDLSLDDLILGDTIVKEKLVSDGKMIKRVRLSVLSMIFFLVGILSALLFIIIPSHVSEKGILQEPWFLVILATFSILTGLVIGIINLIALLANHYKFNK
ncbi:helix-turn-helix domain-containing protein [Staphylococcus caeli]|uniref:helix-turn-helix domain-containing protein n=1 Tax=Staphylococcus caeli TaxID=2201815 RepID=UPI003F55BFED